MRFRFAHVRGALRYEAKPRANAAGQRVYGHPFDADNHVQAAERLPIDQYLFSIAIAMDGVNTLKSCTS